MNESEPESIANAVREHGNQLGNNLAHLKRFLKAQREEQQAFLSEQRELSDKALGKATAAAIWSAVAAGAAALATIVLAIDAYLTP